MVNYTRFLWRSKRRRRALKPPYLRCSSIVSSQKQRSSTAEGRQALGDLRLVYLTGLVCLYAPVTGDTPSELIRCSQTGGGANYPMDKPGKKRAHFLHFTALKEPLY